MADRRESVTLSVKGNFQREMTSAAASVALLNRELERVNSSSDGISRRLGAVGRSADRMHSSLGTLRGDLRGVNSELAEMNERHSLRFSSSARRMGNDLDSVSGRVGLLGEALAVLGPAALPIGALALPAVTGLSQALGVSALAAGTAVLAFQGVGDALTAVNTAALEPTQANLNAARDAMARITPQAREFVQTLSGLGDVGRQLQAASGRGLFPGLTSSLIELTDLAPQAERILDSVGTTLGELADKGAHALTSRDWAPFFAFVEREARPTLTRLAQVVGDVSHGMAELLVAASPASNGFLSFLTRAADGFDRWATGLEVSDSFTQFLAYVQRTGPQVAATATSLMRAIAGIAEAAAPIGGPVLKAIEAIANLLASVASSPAGTPLIAMAAGLLAVNRALAVTRSLAGGGGVFARFTPNVAAASSSMRGLARDFRTVAAAQRATVGSAGGMSAFVARTQAAAGAQTRLAAASRTVASNAPRAGAAVAALAVMNSDVGKSAIGSTASLAAMGGLVAGPWGAAIGGGIGLVQDFARANNDVETAVSGTNQALASGDFARIAAQRSKVLEDIAQRQKALDKINSSNPIKGVPAIITQLDELSNHGLENMRGQLNRLDNALDGAGRGTDGLSTKMRLARDASEIWATSLQRVNNILSGRADMRAFEQSIDDASAAFKENGRTLDDNTDRGRRNAAALDQIASSALAVADNMKGANRERFLRNARQDFVEFAVEMGMGEKKAKRFANQLGLVGRQRVDPKINLNSRTAEANLARVDSQQKKLDRARPNIKVTANTNAALAELSAVQRAIAGIKSKSVTITTVRRTTNANLGEQAAMRAHGGPVYGPGTATSDSIPAMLSNGEWVIRTAAVRKYGDGLLRDINSLRLAGGGRATTRGVRYSASSVSLDGSGGGGRALNKRDRQFDLSGEADIRSELSEFAQAVKEAGLRLGKNFKELGARAVGLGKAYEKQSARLDDLKSRAADLKSAAAGSFNNDAFGNGLSLSGSITQLMADRNDANAQNADLLAAQKKGLSGATAAAVAASGNRTLAADLARSSAAQIASYERLVGSRTAAQNRLGSTAVQISGMASDIAKLSGEMAATRRAFEAIEGRIEDGVYKGAKAGVEGRTRQQARKTTAMIRTGART